MRAIAISRNVRLHLFLLTASLLWIILPTLQKTPSQQIRNASTQAAAQFLYLVDTEEYAKSWEVTARDLKHLFSQEVWNEKISEIREFLGPIVERMQQEINYTTYSSEAMQAGEYVVMTFISEFEFRERVIETLTLVLNSDDQWKVVGYFLR